MGLLMLLLLCVQLLVFCVAIDIDALLGTLTLEEKVGQMTQLDFDLFVNNTSGEIDWANVTEWFDTYKFGSLFNSPFSNGQMNGKVGWNATEWRSILNRLQTMAQESDAKIPLLYGLDSIHGATFVYGAALFPQAINVAASFNPDVAYASGLITGKDTRAAGVPWLFSPVLGLGLNPLWARFAETFGEDAYLTSVLGSALIRGIQSTSDGYDGVPARAAACMKHFIAYSDPYNGHDRSPVMLPDRTLRQLYLPAFKAAVEAGVLSAMESYQEVGGVPMASSAEYLKKLLRLELNYTGMLVTDYHEIENLYGWHHVADSVSSAVKLAMDDTSIDMSMVANDASFTVDLIALVQAGEVSMARIDQSVRRILELKNELGLFDDPVPSMDDTSLTSTVGSAYDYEVSLNASRESITLLKNTDNTVLPLLDSSAVGVGGPTCDSLVSQLNGWSFHWQGSLSDAEFQQGVTILEGLQQLSAGSIVPLAGPSVTATNLDNVNMTDVLLAISSASPPLEALVVCVGEGTYEEKPGDIDDLAIAQGQVDYVNALSSTGLPIVTVLVSGRPRLLSDISSLSAAVLQSYNPGPMGGQAVAEAIFGLLSPSGRLPYTYPKFQADISYPYSRKTNDQCTSPTNGFDYVPCEVEWSFGTGLGYHQLVYEQMTSDLSVMDENDVLKVSALVTNAGSYPGSHYDAIAGPGVVSRFSVLLFLTDEFRRVTPEYKLLKRFDRVALAPGESATVSWVLTAADLEYVGVDSKYILEGGQFRLGLGPESDCRAYNFTGADPMFSQAAGNPNEGQLCNSFTLQLSSSYHPECDYGCDLWARGICGSSVDPQLCVNTCVTQNWGWNYVECLEDAVVNEQCDAEFQCYDAFGTSNSASGRDASDAVYTQDDYLLATLLCSLGGFVVGVIGTVYASNYYYAIYWPAYNSTNNYHYEPYSKQYSTDASGRFDPLLPAEDEAAVNP